MSYTPGHSVRSVAFMADRRAAEHFGFLLPHLRSGQRLLDLGCGPGTMTAELAAVVTPGPVTGVDASDAQFARGSAAAERLGVGNLVLRRAVLPPLPFPDAGLDVVTAHALVEHLPDPAAVLREARRVLVPGGLAAIATIDWGGFLLAPTEPAITRAMDTYAALMRAGGGHPTLGRALPGLLEAAGFRLLETAARYENHADLLRITEYLAATLERRGEPGAATALRDWAPRARLFAQAWVWALGVA